MTELVTMPKYDAYKNSGFDWLGDIPAEWELKRFKFILSEINQRSDSGEETLLSVSQYTGVTRKIDKVSEGELLTNAKSLEGYKKVTRGDLVSNIMLAWNGSLGVSEYDGITSPAYSVYRFKNGCSERFYHYLLRTDIYKAEFKRRSTGVIESRLRLYSDDFFDVLGVLPPFYSQIAIVNYLDKKTVQLDEAIAIKKEQIGLLKERKQIIIQQTVTQGLNPDAPMKDSGVDWIGQIPVHWAYEPIKYSLKGIIDCEHKTAPFVDEIEYFVVRTTNVKGGKLQMEGAKYTHGKGFKEWTRRGVPTPGDVLLTREAPAGEACLVPENMNICLGQRMVWLKVDRSRLLPEFAISLIYSSIGRTYIDFLSSGSTVLHFNMADINNIPVVLPPLEEQHELVKFIRTESLKVNGVIAIQQQQIAKLKEYKITLINSAVTGKIKVL
jgi:type I restriction enzyme S subunit